MKTIIYYTILYYTILCYNNNNNTYLKNKRKSSDQIEPKVKAADLAHSRQVLQQGLVLITSEIRPADVVLLVDHSRQELHQEHEKRYRNYDSEGRVCVLVGGGQPDVVTEQRP